MKRADRKTSRAAGRGTDATFGNRGKNRPASAPQPYTVIDNRAPSTYGYNNTLIEAAIQTQDRGSINLVDYDFHRTITSIGRRTLLSLGRTMFWRIPTLSAAIMEQASLTVTPFTPQVQGANAEWGKRAWDWLHDWHKVCDLAGWPYDFHTYCEMLVLNSIVDGDPFTLMTEDEAGNPRIQQIGSHRVGSRYLTATTAKVKLVPVETAFGKGAQLWIDGVLVDGALPIALTAPVEWEAPIIDGAVVDGIGRALAYRTYTDPAMSQAYQDYSARDCFPTFIPMFPGQLRGPSLLASSIFDWQDIREWKRFEMIAQKTFATKTIVEQNETGDAEGMPKIIPSQYGASPTNVDQNGANGTTPVPGPQTTLAQKPVTAGEYTFLKAGSGSKLEAFDWDRPRDTAQNFNELMIRDAMRGTEWDAFFSLDPKHVGGAPMRVVVDRVNRTLRKRRKMVNKSATRVAVWAIAKAIERGELPFDPEWYKWHHVGASDLTADRRYDSETDKQEYELGWMTLDDIEKRRGNGDWVKKREQKEKEVDDLFARAKKLADKYDVTIQEAITQLQMIGQSTLTRRETEEEPVQPQEGGSKPAALKKPKKDSDQ